MGSRRLNLAANPSQQAEKALSPFHKKKGCFIAIAPTYERGFSRRLLSAGSIPAKQPKPGGNSERKRRGRSGVEELVDSSGP